MTIDVFVNPSGQRENLGDSVLRRAYLDALRESGVLHVYVGEHPGYVSGLGLRDADIAYGSKSAFIRAVTELSRRSPIAFAANAGEIVTGTNAASTTAWQEFLIRRARLSGGAAIAAGVSLRPRPARLRPLVIAQLRTLDLLSWREPRSRELAGGVGDVHPDWAFALGSPKPVEGPRQRLAIALRGDRARPSPTWFDAVRAVAALHGLLPTVIVQVARDAGLARAVRDELGADLLEWHDEPHREHEERVRSLYRESAVVVSDRIHALIIGMTEGAVPIGLATSDVGKVARTFSAVTEVGVAMQLGDAPGETAAAIAHVEAALGARGALERDLRGARDALASLRAEIAIALHEGSDEPARSGGPA